MEKQENIIATYQQIIQETEKQLQKARKRIRYISLLRLILFVEAVASAIIFWSDGWLKLIVLTVLPIIAFIWLVQSHNRWFYWKDYLKKKIEINQQELRALQYDFSDFDNGKEYIDPSHLYTFDLDIFGEHSLFQYINRTSTPIGKQRLANWFNAHLEEKEANNVRKRFGNYLQNLSFDNNSACSDYFIKASHPTPLQLKNGSTVRATIGNTLSSVSSRQQ